LSHRGRSNLMVSYSYFVIIYSIMIIAYTVIGTWNIQATFFG
jgi:hypothetical protein